MENGQRGVRRLCGRSGETTEERAVVRRRHVLDKDVARVEGGQPDLHGRVVSPFSARQRRHAELLRVEGDRVVGAVAAAHAHLARPSLEERQTEQHRARQRLSSHVMARAEGGMCGGRHALQRAHVHRSHRLALLDCARIVPHQVEVHHRHGNGRAQLVLALRQDHELVLLVEGAAVVGLGGEGGVDGVDLEQPGDVRRARDAERGVLAHAVLPRPHDEAVVQIAHVALAQVREVVDVEALEVQLLLALEGGVGRGVRRGGDGSHPLFGGRTDDQLRLVRAQRRNDEERVLLEQRDERRGREVREVGLEDARHVVDDFERHDGAVHHHDGRQREGERLVEVETRDERRGAGLHHVEVLDDLPEVHAPQLVLLLVHLDSTHHIPSESPLLQHRVGDGRGGRLRLLLLLLLPLSPLLLRRDLADARRARATCLLQPLLLRVLLAVAQVQEHAVLLVGGEQVPRLQRAVRVERRGAAARAALHAAVAPLTADAAHQLRPLSGDAVNALDEHLGLVEVERELRRVQRAHEVDVAALWRAAHRSAGLLADEALHVAGGEAMGAHGAHPVSVGHHADAVAALVHGDVALVTEDEHVARLAVALVADVAHLAVVVDGHETLGVVG